MAMTKSSLTARVLVVDADRSDRDAAGRVLGEMAEVETLGDGAALLDALAREPADLVVADLALPDLSASEFLERLRTEHAGTDIVLLAGDAALERAVQELERGVSEVLSKPVADRALRHAAQGILERRRLRSENQRLRDALHTAEECRALTPCLDPGKVYPVALDLLLGRLSRSRGLAAFHRTGVPQGDALAFRGLSEAEAGRLREVLIEHKPLDLEGAAQILQIDHSVVHDALREAGVDGGRLLSVPIRGEEGEAGVIWIFQDGREFESQELARAAIVASYAEAALHNAERYHHAKERAFIDDVTEVYNARYLLSALENEIRRAERYETRLSVLFLDLDRFKLVNDRHGHLVGSQTLRNLSQVLLQCVRQVDTLARYGGDEFTILLVDTDLEEALVIAERIRRTVEDTVFEGGEGSLRLTISIGVAAYPDDGSERDRVLDAADKAMYRAKSLGRNRVCSASEL